MRAVEEGATMRLIQFRDPSDGPVYINPAHVAFVRRIVISDLSGPVAEWTEVGTTGGVVTIKKTVSEVVKVLR